MGALIPNVAVVAARVHPAAMSATSTNKNPSPEIHRTNDVLFFSQARVRAVRVAFKTCFERRRLPAADKNATLTERMISIAAFVFVVDLSCAAAVSEGADNAAGRSLATATATL